MEIDGARPGEAVLEASTPLGLKPVNLEDLGAPGEPSRPSAAEGPVAPGVHQPPHPTGLGSMALRGLAVAVAEEEPVVGEVRGQRGAVAWSTEQL